MCLVGLGYSHAVDVEPVRRSLGAAGRTERAVALQIAHVVEVA